MIRRILAAAVPFALFACAGQDAPEDVAASSDDITAIDDLAPLEANLGLVKDAARTRSEDVLKAGPCYQKMAASGRDWNLRRYTTGAALFFTRPDGEPLDPVTCVDVDVYINGGPSTMALSGVSLDLVQRFGLGRFLAGAATMQQPGASGLAGFTFDHGVLRLRAGAFEASDEIASYDGAFAGFIHRFDADAFPSSDRVRNNMPAVANVAYQYAKVDPGLPLAKDPVGRFVSVEEIATGFTAHFEKVDVTYLAGRSTEAAASFITVTDRATNEMTASCAELEDTDAPRFRCSKL